jgi:1-aminocyclopropane-1-carboxylate deaminase
MPMSLSANKLNTKAVAIQRFDSSILNAQSLQLDVLRLDQVHPIMSGNKLFKLKYYLEDAIKNHCDTVKTFGGFYSNHIAATAYAAKICGLKSIGIIRGEAPKQLTPTLEEAVINNMQLEFASSQEYQQQKRFAAIDNNLYIIPEGGYGELGMKGTSDILNLVDQKEKYDHTICAVGTGTTAAGLIKALHPHQKLIGISSLKGAFTLEDEIKTLLPKNHDRFQLIHDYHFGGFGKHPEELIQFIKEVWKSNHLPTDIVYTSKTLYGILDLAEKHFFKPNSKLLMIHTGGLQGNRSLPQNSLPFL